MKLVQITNTIQSILYTMILKELTRQKRENLVSIAMVRGVLAGEIMKGQGLLNVKILINFNFNIQDNFLNLLNDVKTFLK